VYETSSDRLSLGHSRPTDTGFPATPPDCPDAPRRPSRTLTSAKVSGDRVDVILVGPFKTAEPEYLAQVVYADVPNRPASHGCARLPLPEARLVYDFVSIGTPVRVI
jgi:hypothetical protein